jgi:tRNA dimethylallyltransferase
MEMGFLDEVSTLLDEPAGLSRTAAQALGYKELIAHLRGDVSLDDALDTAIRRTRRFARRQERWFRRDPRIRWLDGAKPLEALEAVLEECRTCD